jgi:hypothetical protein
MGEWGVSGGFSKDFKILNSVTVYFSRCPARILRYCHQRRKEVGKVWVPISTANGGVKCVGESSKKMNLVYCMLVQMFAVNRAKNVGSQF